jgi:hypothetical protein
MDALYESNSPLPESIELVHEAVALVQSLGSGWHPVAIDDWDPERPKADVETADTHAPNVESPSEEPCWWEESFNLL